MFILTARDLEANEEHAMKAGACAFFQRPVDNDALLADMCHAMQHLL